MNAIRERSLLILALIASMLVPATAAADPLPGATF